MVIELSLTGEDVKRACFVPSMGVGLIRAEYLLRRCDKPITHPDAISFIARYISECASAVEPHTVWYRTIDMESSEANMFPFTRNIYEEKNTMVGLRGVRRSLHFLDEFHQELSAVKHALDKGSRVGLLLPLVSSKAEVIRALEQISSHQISCPIGLMIETPAAAINSEEIFSLGIERAVIGYNDLTSFTLAADRRLDNFNPRDPAVDYLVQRTMKAARKYDVQCLACIDGSPGMIEHVQRLGFSEIIVPVKTVSTERSEACTGQTGQDDIDRLMAIARHRIKTWYAQP